MTLLIHQFGRQAVSEEDIIGGWLGDFPSRDAALRSVCPARRFSPCTRPWLIRICARRNRPAGQGRVDRAVLSAADLGVEAESSLSDVYKRARQVGLELCSAEVGPQLRLDYGNQPVGEALDIAMEPVAETPQS